MSEKQFDLLKSLLEKLISILSHNDPYKYWIPLISALIGAFAVLIPQIIMWIIKNKREKKDKSRELLTNAYHNSFLLIEYYKKLVMHKVHKYYWYKASSYETDHKYHDLYYERHHKSSEKAFQTELKISSLLADYIKTIRHFQILNGKNEKISSTLIEMGLYKPRKPSQFDGVPNSSLHEAEVKEEESLNEAYSKYKDYFDKINSEMENSLK